LLRAKVQQATGMISVQLGVSLELALSRLRAYASVAERPIDEVADDVISHRVRFDDGQPDDTLRPTR
jgi:AmiR/NasT family two-component response regulator